MHSYLTLSTPLRGGGQGPQGTPTHSTDFLSSQGRQRPRLCLHHVSASARTGPGIWSQEGSHTVHRGYFLTRSLSLQKDGVGVPKPLQDSANQPPFSMESLGVLATVPRLLKQVQNILAPKPDFVVSVSDVSPRLWPSQAAPRQGSSLQQSQPKSSPVLLALGGSLTSVLPPPSPTRPSKRGSGL